MRKFPIARLNEFFATVAKGQKLYLPVDDKAAGGASFVPWKEGTEYSRATNTLRSAKDFFFPQMETLADFKMKGKEIEVIDQRVEGEDFVLFGVRACDAASFSILDTVFLSDPVDTYYENRRRHGTIISVSCVKPASTCFCTLYGIDPTEPVSDVAAWMTEDALYLEGKTEKGEKLMRSLSSLLEPCGTEAVEKQKVEVKPILERLPFGKLDMKRFRGENQQKLFDDPRWKRLSDSCLGCGTCTFVCPTCQCFDIRDFKTVDGGVERFRCWDSCMYSEFTKMAAANPRLTQTERFRQRFMHKLVYYPSNNNGVYGCVGCGRCLVRCPIHMHIVKVIKALGEEE